MRDLLHPQIAHTESFGSRDYDIKIIGKCRHCGCEIYSDDAEYCSDMNGNFFCSESCILGEYLRR